MKNIKIEILKYDAENIYNCNESALFWKQNIIKVIQLRYAKELKPTLNDSQFTFVAMPIEVTKFHCGSSARQRNPVLSEARIITSQTLIVSTYTMLLLG